VVVVGRADALTIVHDTIEQLEARIRKTLTLTTKFGDAPMVRVAACPGARYGVTARGRACVCIAVADCSHHTPMQRLCSSTRTTSADKCASAKHGRAQALVRWYISICYRPLLSNPRPGHRGHRNGVVGSDSSQSGMYSECRLLLLLLLVFASVFTCACAMCGADDRVSIDSCHEKDQVHAALPPTCNQHCTGMARCITDGSERNSHTH
jgi:hypothetical protein